MNGLPLQPGDRPGCCTDQNEESLRVQERPVSMPGTEQRQVLRRQSRQRNRLCSDASRIFAWLKSIPAAAASNNHGSTALSKTHTLLLMNFTSIRLITFDCYGTLIDWETGMLASLRSLFASSSVSDAELLEHYGEAEARLESGAYLP